MRILYVFPHPDDESFGPALAISQQRRAGHEVYLLTLTKGGATKLRHKFGHTVEQMGEVRAREMQCVAKVLGLSDLTVLDLPDSGLKEMDPREIERVVEDHIRKIRPDVVVTYAVHGISGFPDHLVAHAVVKRVFLALQDGGEDYLRRLAFFTLDEAFAKGASGEHHLNYSPSEAIDCVVRPDARDEQAFQKALDCYETYQEMIEKTGVRKGMKTGVCFEIFGEDHHPPLDDLCKFS